MKAINLVVIGCGEHALRAHVMPALKLDQFCLVGIVDSKPEVVRNNIANTVIKDIPIVKDLHLIANDSYDAVLIATPDEDHASLLQAAVNAGKHVLCEKPLAVTKEDLVIVTDAIYRARKKSLIVTSCHPRRFDPPYLFIKNQLDIWIEQFGQLLDVALDFTYNRPSKEGLHIGLLIDHVNHEIDILNWFLGFSDIEVTKRHDDQTRYKVDGRRINDGVTFTFHGTRRLDKKIYPESIKLRFERGDVIVWTNGKCLIYDHEQGSQDLIDCPAVDYELRFSDLMVDWANSIQQKCHNYLSSEDLILNSAIGTYLSDQDVWTSETKYSW